MTVYMVERNLKGISMQDLGAAQQAAIAKSAELTGRGVPVRYIRTTFTPADGCCLCLFEAGSETAVRSVNDEAGLPYERVVEALDLTP